MKKSLISFIVLIGIFLSSFAFFGCAQNSSTNKILIYTSIYPLYDFAQKVGGDKVEVVNMVQPGQEAHDYEPSTAQIVGLNKADLILINGLGLEGWANNLSQNLKQKVVDTSKNVPLLEADGSQHEHDEHEHNHGNLDPHIWLSIKNAKQQMKNIKDALVQIDPQNAEYYQQNYTRYAFLFDGLDAQYTQILSQAQNKNLVVAHAAFAYLANEYNLTQHALTGVQSNTEPNAQTLANMILFVNQNNIKAVFFQDQVNNQVAQVIERETNAKLYPLLTLEFITFEQQKNGEDYLSLMAKNLVFLQKGLA
jgi:zinc transport system substrate-binding protein